MVSQIGFDSLLTAVFLLPLQGEGRDGDGVIAPSLLPHPHPNPPLEGEGIAVVVLRRSLRRLPAIDSGGEGDTIIAAKAATLSKPVPAAGTFEGWPDTLKDFKLLEPL